MPDDQPIQEEESLEEWAARLGSTVNQKTGTTFMIGGPKKPPSEKPSNTASESEPEG
jgi:hypothetical protein